MERVTGHQEIAGGDGPPRGYQDGSYQPDLGGRGIRAWTPVMRVIARRVGASSRSESLASPVATAVQVRTVDPLHDEV